MLYRRAGGIGQRRTLTRPRPKIEEKCGDWHPEADLSETAAFWRSRIPRALNLPSSPVLAGVARLLGGAGKALISG
jgi:hypothetical protein